MERYQATMVFNSFDELGEGPLWSSSEQALYWVDVLGAVIRRWHPSTGEFNNWNCPGRPTALAPKAAGDFIVTLFDGVYDFDPRGGTFTRRIEVEPEIATNRCNDSKAGPDGRYWFGTMQNNIAVDGSPIEINGHTGSLYSLDSRQGLKRHLGQVGISNTLAWGPGGNLFYFADSLTGSIRRFPFDAVRNELGTPMEFPVLDSKFGVPDGSTIDAEGCLWNARWDGRCVLRFSPEGELLGRIDVPAQRPTSVTFGDSDLRSLYITTASDGVNGEYEHDGCVFAVQLPVGGLPAHSFHA